jgi:uncharacterized protein YbjT (DUF2867 family)
MNKQNKIILVTGATGNQGGATARHLLANGWQIRALVRDPNKPSAQALAQQGAEVVAGDYDDRASLNAALNGVYGAFSVQTFFERGVEVEEQHGKAFADAAKAAGVQHLVYTSVGGAEKHTGIPHFDSKWHIEEHIRALGLPVTILRPVFFMDNFNFMFRQSVIEQSQITWAMHPQIKLQMIAADDIGAWATIAFENPETYIGKALEIAGDELTMPQTAETLSKVVGRPIAFNEIPLEAIKSYGEEMYLMLKWFNEVGYQADISNLRQIRPQMANFEQWLHQNGWGN